MFKGKRLDEKRRGLKNELRHQEDASASKTGMEWIVRYKEKSESKNPGATEEGFFIFFKKENCAKCC